MANVINPLLNDSDFIRFWEERAIFDTSYLAQDIGGEVEVSSYSIELLEGDETLGINFIVKRKSIVDAVPEMSITGLFGWNRGLTRTRPIDALLLIMNAHYEMETLKQSGLGKEIL